jgi:predicted NAD/FAD-dependent oxidoreductase
MKYAVIGAGISGITLAKNLNDSVIVEKSRGIGGRIASRRLGAFTLNHGSHIESINDPHDWIKQEAQGLHILKSWEVSYLEFSSNGIKIYSNQNQMIEAKNLILTVPAPQAQLILDRSGLPSHFLDPVSYKSSIQFMLLAESKTNVLGLEKYFSKVHQKELIQNQSLSLYEIKDEFLEKFIEFNKDEIKDFCLELIDHQAIDCHAHKWRYSEVSSSIAPEFQTYFKNKCIFLAGDYFGNKGIESSLESVKVVLKSLKDYM